MFPIRRLPLTVGLTAAVLAVAAPAALAKTVTQTVRSGTISASFSYSRIGSFQYRHLALTIRSNGAVQYAQPVRSSFCHQYCEPSAPGEKSKSIVFRRLSSNGTQLMLGLYSGGAHCCSIVQIFNQAAGSRRWTRSSFNFGDPGYQLVDLNHDGTDEFLSADDRFAYEFTDYAASGMPLLIMRWSGGRFVDVTGTYPARIARDAAIWMKAFRQERQSHYNDTTGIIAAWAADEDELGHAGMVASFLHHAAAAGQLNSGLGNEVPQNARFITALNRFLREQGYL